MPDRLSTAVFSKFAERIAIIWNDDEISYTDLAKRMIAESEKLKAKGLKAGDHLLLYSPDPELIAAVFLGALRNGIVPGIIPVGLTESHLQIILQQANAKLLLCNHNFAVQFRGLNRFGTKLLHNLPALDNEIALKKHRFLGKKFMVFAGATCEYPHWLLSSTKFLTPLARAERNRFELNQNDKIFCAAGLSGVASLVNGFLCPLLYGMTTIFANIWTSPAKLSQMIAHYKPRMVIANLSQYQSILKHVAPNVLQEALDNTSYCIAVGEAIDEKTGHQWHQVTQLELLEQPILLTGSRHANDLAYAAATDSQNENLLVKKHINFYGRKFFRFEKRRGQSNVTTALLMAVFSTSLSVYLATNLIPS